MATIESLIGDDGEPPLLLTIFDLFIWIRVFKLAYTHLPKTIACLKNFSIVIHDLLLHDLQEIELVEKNAKITEGAVKAV